MYYEPSLMLWLVTYCCSGDVTLLLLCVCSQATLEALYEQTRLLSERALDVATQAFDESAKISVKADDLVNNLDVDGLKQEAQRLKDEVSNPVAHAVTSLLINSCLWHFLTNVQLEIIL